MHISTYTLHVIPQRGGQTDRHTEMAHQYRAVCKLTCHNH